MVQLRADLHNSRVVQRLGGSLVFVYYSRRQSETSMQSDNLPLLLTWPVPILQMVEQCRLSGNKGAYLLYLKSVLQL